MALWNLWHARKRSSAKVAAERLRIVITHEKHHLQSSKPYLPQLHQELLDVIRRYVPITEDAVQVEVNQRDQLEILAMTIMLPDLRNLPPPQQPQKP